MQVFVVSIAHNVMNSVTEYNCTGAVCIVHETFEILRVEGRCSLQCSVDAVISCRLFYVKPCVLWSLYVYSQLVSTVVMY